MAPTLRSRRRKSAGRKSRGSDEEDERSILQLQDDAAELPTLRKELKALKAELAAAKEASSGGGGGGHRHGHGHGHGGGGELSGDYRRAGVASLVKSRGGWLCLFLMSLFLTSLVIAHFDETLEKHIQLSYFMPLLIGHGGNAGGQTIGTVLGALSARQISVRDAGKVVAKECIAGLGTGALTGVAVIPLLVYLNGDAMHVTITVLFTIVVLTVLSAFLAAALPFLVLFMGLDPTAIAAPAMTTLVDVGGLLAYFLIAQVVFQAHGKEL